MFTPVIEIVQADPEGAFLLVKDTTGTSPDSDTGYGALPDAPADFSEVDKFLFLTQYIGEDAVARTVVTGAMDTGVSILFAVVDGVYLVTVLYRKPVTGVTYTLSEDGKTVTFSVGDPSSLFASAYAVALSDNDLYSVISSRNSTTIVLETAQADPDGSEVWAYYRAEAYILVQNNATEIITCAISAMAVNRDSCNFDVTLDVLKKILLKKAAEVAYDCEDYVEAQNAVLAISSEATCNCSCS